MDKFSRWGITKDIDGEARVRFLVGPSGDSVKILKTRRDAVLFLSKNPHVELKPEDFVFKSETIGNKVDADPLVQDWGEHDTLVPGWGDHDLLDEGGHDSVEQDQVGAECVQEHDMHDHSAELQKDCNKRKKVKQQEIDFQSKIAKVTIKSDPNPTDEYEPILMKLHEIRQTESKRSVKFSEQSFTDLQNVFSDLKTDDDPIQFVKTLCQNEELFSALKMVLCSKIESEVELNSLKDCKAVSMEFPVDQSSNFYCSIIEEASEKMPNLLTFIVNIIDSETQFLTANYAIKIATLICNFLCCKDKRHSALKKLNTLHLMFQKSSVGNLKTFGQKGVCSGHTEATRLVEEMSELAEFFKSSKYSLSLGMQITMDNVDVMLKGKLEHWLLAYSRMDPVQTNMLSDEKPDFDIKKATYEIVFLSASETEYLKACSRVVLAKKLSEIGFSTILRHVPYKPLHKYPEMLEHQDIFFECLEPLQEMEHTDMGQFLLIVQKIVLERLNVLTEFKYKDEIEAVINKTGTAEELLKNDNLVSELLKTWGTIIIGGDLLTVERIDQNISLRSSNQSEFEKCGFIGPPRIAIFHFRQNLVLKLFAAMLPNLNESSNPGTLNCFRALTEKAKDISNKESKIKDSFEIHYQFLVVVSEVYLEEKIISFASEKYGTSNLKTFSDIFKEKGEEEIISLLNEILENSSHAVFFEQNVTLENLVKSKKDDLENTGEFFVSLWLLLKTLDFITKSGDPEGIEFMKKNGILLTLSLHSTASKYVHKLFHELLKLKTMSERMKLRFNSGHFIKFHGKSSSGPQIRPSDLNNRSEDLVCEWLVGGVKNSFKTLGGNYTEETIDKKIKAMSLVNSILDQDCKSLMLDGGGPGTSWDRFESEEVERFRSYVKKLKPFRPSERTPVNYLKQNTPKSLYSGLSKDLITQFFNMKLKNMN